jgi:hypothetical protein
MNDDLTSILAEALDEFLYSAQQSSVATILDSLSRLTHHVGQDLGTDTFGRR